MHYFDHLEEFVKFEGILANLFTEVRGAARRQGGGGGKGRKESEMEEAGRCSRQPACGHRVRVVRAARLQQRACGKASRPPRPPASHLSPSAATAPRQQLHPSSRCPRHHVITPLCVRVPYLFRRSARPRRRTSCASTSSTRPAWWTATCSTRKSEAVGRHTLQDCRTTGPAAERGTTAGTSTRTFFPSHLFLSPTNQPPPPLATCSLPSEPPTRRCPALCHHQGPPPCTNTTTTTTAPTAATSTGSTSRRRSSGWRSTWT